MSKRGMDPALEIYDEDVEFPSKGHPNRCQAATYVREELPDNPYWGEKKRDDDGNPVPRRCRKFALHGAKVCYTHGGNAPNVRRKAEEDLREAALTIVGSGMHRIQKALDLSDDEIIVLKAIEQGWKAWDRFGAQDDETSAIRRGLGALERRYMEQNSEEE